MIGSRGRIFAAVLAGACLAVLAPSASASVTAEESAPAWHLEPVAPPPIPGEPSTAPIGLGKVGDIEFWAPNRGLLITAGNPPSVPPGVWAYDGISWHELSSVCGATEGRIAWAGPDEFWTVSDGRPGQAIVEGTGAPPLADNTLCHFAGGAVVGSYASLAFRPDSYQPMHGAGCAGASDCWFGGDVLPAGQTGSFHLHWDGAALSPVPNPQGRAVEDIRAFGGRLYESVRATSADQIVPPESAVEPSLLHAIAPNGISPTFSLLRLETAEGRALPDYSPEELAYALDYLQLGADEESLWGAANPAQPAPAGSAPAEVTILVHHPGGTWAQVLGPTTDPPGGNPFTKYFTKEHEEQNLIVRSIAPNPGSGSAWLALDTKQDAGSPNPLAHARVALISGEGAITEEQVLPSPQEEAEGIGPKGGAERIMCSAPNNCWLATTQGWIFHFSDAANRRLAQDTDPAFSTLISFRPPDQGIPTIVPDAPPVDNSGLPGEQPIGGAVEPPKRPETRIPVPLLSHIRTRLVRGTTLELSFHLAVRARLRLLAKRGRHVVAGTPTRTYKAGNRSLTLRLDRNSWPTKLDLQSHALAPLPTISAGSESVSTVGTGLYVLPQGLPRFGEPGRLP